MKTTLLTFTIIMGLVTYSKAQTSTLPSSKVPVWTEADRKYLLDNLTRSKDELIKETQGLSRKQFNFKESPDRWSINQIVEHLSLWETIFMHEISRALAMPADTAFTYFAPDSVFLDQDSKDLKKNNALDYTKPFSFTVPLGNNEGTSNMIWLTTMRNESIEFVKNEHRNIRLQYDYCSGANVHQYFIMIFSHNDRHLRQIKKVKTHPNYPK